ncbi:MAG TPA: bifunctional diguanylate cyclase/phosphodiesterase [Solirubrobacteraceae bacterium]|nr:bifunctional diguanylate cyclase/phosphodiesterase [Solirubrobacteraceae bacterium]
MSNARQVPGEVLRARRTAATARGVLGLCGLLAVLADPGLVPWRWTAIAGFGFVAATATVQIALPRARWLILEESLAGVAAILIVGLAHERVTVLSLLWLSAVASGVLARGGRQHWVGRALILAALVLPIVREQRASFAYLAFVVAALALLLTCGRVTRELRALLDRARHDAAHDGLTGALTREAFRSRLDLLTAVDPDSPVAVLLVDLDGFGQLNKTLGHAAGDAALVALVRRARRIAGDDALIGRMGGDEFALAVTGSEPVALGHRLVDELAEGAGGHPPLRASVGVAQLPTDGPDAESVLRAGDVALRVAKRTASGTVASYAGGSFSSGGGGAQADLDRLIRGEGLAIVVQPIVSIGGPCAHAYEALARFHVGNTTSPLHWFALADEFGRRDELELACVRAALGLLAQRPAGTRLSINLSGSLLLDPRLEELLAAAGPLDGLILEVTENSLLDDTPGLHVRISELIGRGVRFAIDDMGAGYSGLRQLTLMRPSYLKLDRSLVHGIETDADRGALVSAMLGYARQTGGHLVAEGVETDAELDTLRQLGVDLVQGFLLARPGPPWPSVGRPAAAVAAAMATVPAAAL